MMLSSDLPIASAASTTAHVEGDVVHNDGCLLHPTANGIFAVRVPRKDKDGPSAVNSRRSTSNEQDTT
jgi:hypothetical protein